MRRIIACVCLAAALCSGAGCAPRADKAADKAANKQSPGPSATPPALGQARRLEPGVLLHEVTLPGRGAPSRLWIYLPEAQSPAKLPCVLIAPAGTRMFHGNSLGEGHRPEHLPYVRAGFAVVAYELDGPLEDDASEEAVGLAVLRFKQSEAGLVNARAALDYALAKVPQIDPSRVFTAGHSSAATTSLLVAEREPRVRACVAYAPVTDLEKYFGKEMLAAFTSELPDYGEFVRRSSPIANAKELRCPLFLFHAEDDENVNISESVNFAREVSKHNPAVTFVQAAEGGHYDSMLEEGVPKAIEWLKALK